MKVQYKVVIAQSGKQDIKVMKKYILEQFKYVELAENFSKKIKKVLKDLDTFPHGYQPTEFIYREYRIYLKPKDTYLIFYTIDEQKHTVTVLRVMQDGMNWKYIVQNWLRGK